MCIRDRRSWFTLITVKLYVEYQLYHVPLRTWLIAAHTWLVNRTVKEAECQDQPAWNGTAGSGSCAQGNLVPVLLHAYSVLRQWCVRYQVIGVQNARPNSLVPGSRNRSGIGLAGPFLLANSGPGDAAGTVLLVLLFGIAMVSNSYALPDSAMLDRCRM